MPQNTEDNPDDIRYSRSILSGKKTVIISFRTCDDGDEAIRRAAHDLGMSPSEFIERAALAAALGVDHLATLEANRLNRVREAFASRLTPVNISVQG